MRGEGLQGCVVLREGRARRLYGVGGGGFQLIATVPEIIPGDEI